jgi:hypothetical protein
MHFNSNLNLAHRKQKKVETMKAPKKRRFYGKLEWLSRGPTYIGEKGWTFGKTFGIKARCYWEHPWGTNWELEGNKEVKAL